MVEEHGADMRTKDKKDARRIQPDFIFDTSSHGGGQHNRREREPPPQNGSNLLSPPGLSRRRDAFGAALTGVQPHPSNRANSPLMGSDPVDEFVFLALVSIPSHRPLYHRKEVALWERLENLAPNRTAAATAIKSATHSYRSAESNARDLILTVWNVMDRHLEHTESIVNALVDTLDEEEKKQDILSSWKGFVIEVRGLHSDFLS